MNVVNAAMKAEYERGRRDERAQVVWWLRNWMRERSLAERIKDGDHCGHGVKVLEGANG